jgi:methylmalonyl-CoA mutase cobalamin-binding subunit
VPRRDHEALKEMGVDAVFPTGTPFAEIVRYIGEKARP